MSKVHIHYKVEVELEAGPCCRASVVGLGHQQYGETISDALVRLAELVAEGRDDVVIHLHVQP